MKEIFENEARILSLAQSLGARLKQSEEEIKQGIRYLLTRMLYLEIGSIQVYQAQSESPMSEEEAKDAIMSTVAGIVEIANRLGIKF